MKYATLPVLLFAGPMHAQTLVDDQPQARTVLLEEYAAIHCGNCPVGHALAASLISAHPGRVTAVELHGGGLAEPGPGEPEFRSEWSTALWSHYGVASQPRGSINRIPVGGQTVISTSGWTNAAVNALALPSPANIGLASTFDPDPRTLTVSVELYYTGDSPGGSDRLSVFLKENHLFGYQQDYQNGAHADYDHENILRAYITDLWGDEVTMTDQATLVSRTYTFAVPEAWDIANCEVVAFVSEYQAEIYQARSVMANGGFTTAVPDVHAQEAPVALPFPVPASDRVFIPLSDSGTHSMIRVSDNLGREVLLNRLSADHAEFDVRAWPAGVYSFSIASEGGMRNGCFVVQH